MIKIIVQLLILPFPWGIRRRILERALNYKISPSSRIGISLIDVESLFLAEHAKIGHLNLVRGLNAIRLESHSRIGNLNWFTAARLFSNKESFPDLIVGRHAAITNRHYFDIQSRTVIGEYATVAGVRGTFLTHEIDISANRQTTRSIEIGRYAFIGSNVVVVAGARIPEFCVVAAGAVVARGTFEPRSLIGGTPARTIRVGLTGEYFSRKTGFVS